MPKFKTKPVIREIEAEQFLEEASILPFASEGACCLGPNGWYVVTAQEQEAPIVNGDWIIREPDGVHFYPCKNEIFRERYEEVK